MVQGLFWESPMNMSPIVVVILLVFKQFTLDTSGKSWKNPCF